MSSMDRIGRVGSNSRNKSDLVFQFGNNLAYPNEAERFTRIDPADVEKQRQLESRKKIQDRYDFKREWKSDIEKERWNKMSVDHMKQQDILSSKQSRARMGKNSVSYNPITLEYHSNANGELLAKEDAKSMYRTSLRSMNLYLKNNSFDPMRCQDIPRVLNPDALLPQSPSCTKVRHPPIPHTAPHIPPPTDTVDTVDTKETKQGHVKYGRRSYKPLETNTVNASSPLSVPLELYKTTNQYAELVKNRLGQDSQEFDSNVSINMLNNPYKWTRHY